VYSCRSVAALTPSSLDAYLWSRAEAGQPVLSLRDAVAAASASTEDVSPLSVLTVIADDADPVARLERASGSSVAESVRLGEVGLLRVQDAEGSYILSVWPTKDPSVFHLAATEPVTGDRWRRVERWVLATAPRIAPFFLNEADFAGTCAELAKYGRVEVSRMTARKLSDNSSYSRGWSGDRRNPRPTYRMALAEAEAIGAAVRTLSLHVREILSLHLRRRAGATYYAGSFRLFDEVVLDRLASAAIARRRLLSDRARTEARIEDAIALRVPAGLFSDPDSIGELLFTLAEQRGAGIAVLHRNPYLHVTLTDYLDGSNFDVFVTQEDECIIYPGYRATLGALTRFTDYVGERFAALELAEVVAARPPSREELFTSG
jgi:hypothetical protein